MSTQPFAFTRLQDQQKLRTADLGQLLRATDLSKETWLLVSPHDDDLCIGAGLLIQAAAQAGVNVQILVVTDGRMGYCNLSQKDSIVAIRKAETLESFQVLGVPPANVQWIAYPDGGTHLYQGRRPAGSGDPAIAGFTGLQNAFTYHLRRVRPQRVFVPTPTDLHPDHQVTHNELMISLFHAGGNIWPELGQPLARVPDVYELAIYCAFADSPTLEVRGDAAVFETKLKSIAAYRSQEQIAAVVASIRQAGAYEYVREVQFRLYSADTYKKLFA